MPVDVVFDHPRPHVGARLRRWVRWLAGNLMVLGGLAVVPLLAVIAVENRRSGHLSRPQGSPPDARAVLALAVLVALVIVVPLVGARLARGNRRLVLFLRRFGYTEASRVIGFAVARTIGGSWRLVTLDDAEIAPVGIPAGTKRFFRAGEVGLSTVGRVWKVMTAACMTVFLASVAGMITLVGVALLRHEQVTTLLDGLRPGEPVQWDLPGAFRLLFIVTIAAVGIGLCIALLSLLALPLAFFSALDASLLRAERASRATIRTPESIEVVGRSIARQLKKRFCPRLVVVDVVSELWRPTVRHLASTASVVLVDVSSPTENLLWELEEVEKLGTRCVYVAAYDKVRHLASDAGTSKAPSDALGALLDGREVLAYTANREGMTRFARALRAKLETGPQGVSSGKAYKRAARDGRHTMRGQGWG